MVVFTLGLIICWSIYGIFPEGSFFSLFLFAALYLVAVLGFGLLISTYCATQIQAMFIAFFFVVIFILMSGLFTSVESLPDRKSTRLNSSHYCASRLPSPSCKKKERSS